MVINVFTIIEALWLIIPAYAANGLIPIAKGKTPMDFGKNFIDNRRILGDGKTWEGAFFGIGTAIVISLFQAFMKQRLPFHLSPVPLDLVPMGVLTGLLLGVGVVVGDATGSFIKRRLNLKRGHPAPILDQEDFLIGALLFLAIIQPIKIEWVIFLLIITPIIHVITNLIGYYTGDKKEPW